ncbi:MAG: type II secretion system protein [Candidatus Aureabacteria bacterium]|nr:type II secretion system protein [Candidatus Auribacterota bacterium]
MKTKGGFSLIEIIVVLSIVAVLMTMIFSKFYAAKEKTRVSTCAGNMRHIIRALHLYTEDYQCNPAGTNAKELYGVLYYPESKGRMGGITALNNYVCPSTRHLPPVPSTNGYGHPLECTATHANSGYFDPSYPGSSIDYWVIAKQDAAATGWQFPDLMHYPACNAILWEASQAPVGEKTHHMEGRNIGYWNESVRFHPFYNFNASKYPYNINDSGNPETVSILNSNRFVDPEANIT